MSRKARHHIKNYRLSLLLMALSLTGCEPQAGEELREPQFAGVCGLRLSIEDSTKTLDVEQALADQHAEFCHWDEDGSGIIARQVAMEACPPLSSIGDVKAEAFKFASASDLQLQCATRGIQITDLAQFTLRDQLAAHVAVCVTWTRRDERPSRLYNGARVAIDELGSHLYKRLALPIFATFVKGQSVTIWMVPDPAIDATSAARNIVAAARDYGYDLVGYGCSPEQSAGSDLKAFNTEAPGPTYSYSGGDPFRGAVYTIAISNDGAVMFDGQAVTLEQLQGRIDSIKDLEPKPNVVVTTGAATRYRNLAPVMAIVQRAGLAKGGVIGGR